MAILTHESGAINTGLVCARAGTTAAKQDRSFLKKSLFHFEFRLYFLLNTVQLRLA